MKVEIVTTGKVLDLPRHPILEALSEAGIIRYLPEPAAPKPQTYLTWSLARTAESGRLHVLVLCSCGGAQEANFNPKPDYCFKHCGDTERIPANLYAKGKAEWAQNAATEEKLREKQAKEQNRQYHINPKTGQPDFRPY